MTFTADSQGGEYTHLLSVNEMPSHTHTNFKVGSTNIGWKSNIFAQGTLAGIRTDPTENVIANATGGSQRHNNVQPWKGTYFWRRTA